MSRIYTKTGDKGETGLVSGKRVKKDNVRLDAYGTLDELNAILGIIRSLSLNQDSDQWLEELQNQLFNAGSRLACDDQTWLAKMPPLKADIVERMEKQMDKWTEQLLPLKNFILPGGHVTAAHLHHARTVCRRAERVLVHLKEITPNTEPIDDHIILFLNRMSDFLFVMARWQNHQHGISEPFWKS